MAKKEEAPKIILERTYVVPLRQQTLKVPPFRKAEKAAKTLREFIVKHMKSSDVKIGRHLNMKLWEHGIKNPPGKVKVVASKNDKGVVHVELEGAPKEEPKVEVVKPSRKPTKHAEAFDHKQDENKAEEAKEIEKEEIKEMQKEQKEHPSKKHAPKEPKQPKSTTNEVAGDRHPPAPFHP